VVLATEALATDVTGERSFISVRAFVYHQVVRLGELALTRAADELLTMSAPPAHENRSFFNIVCDETQTNLNNLTK